MLGKRVLGWLIALLYFIQSVIMILMPRADTTSPLREELRGWHYLVGTLLLVSIGARLYSWWRNERGQPAPAGVRPGYANWTRTLAVTTYAVMFLAPFFGYLVAWGAGLKVHLGPIVTLPSLFAENMRLWLFNGYFHSAIGFTIVLMLLITLLTAAYGWLRYRQGLFRAFPDGFGAMALFGLASTVYGFATFKSPEPGPMAVVRYFGIIAVIFAIGWFIHRNKTATPRGEEAPRKAVFVSLAAVLAIIGLGLYGPHAMFRLTPWPMGEVIPGPDGVTSHQQPVKKVQAWAETEYERKVAAETYKWCGFCHTYGKNDKVKAGPPLYAIFGQKAASVPNFHYTPAMAAKRDQGLVWTDEQLDKFLADPDKLVPGTSMIISSGPVTDPKVRRAVINMLKRDTMKGAIETVPPPEGQ